MRLLYSLLMTLSMLSLVGCQEPERQYVRKAVKQMDKTGLFAEGPEWEAARQKALDAKPATMEEAYDVVREALKVAGGKHSFIITSESLKNIAAAGSQNMPTVTDLGDGFVHIVLPHFSGQTGEMQRDYANIVLNALPDSISGAVIDLRGNTGGNMYPMIAAVGGFMPQGVVLKFKTRKGLARIWRENVVKTVGVRQDFSRGCPVALLTDSLTASSAEATLLCFRGLDYVRTFGAPTAGYASANTTYKMPDGSRLVLTTGCDMAVSTGEVFCDDPIVPDVLTDTPLEDALSWLRNR